MEGSVEMPTIGDNETKEEHTIILGQEVRDRWQCIKKTEGLHSDSETACLLLKWFESGRGSQWAVQCVRCQGMLSVSLTYGQHRHADAVILSVSEATPSPNNGTCSVTTPEVKGPSSGSGSHRKEGDGLGSGHPRTERVCGNSEAGVEKERNLNRDNAQEDEEDNCDAESHFADQRHSSDPVDVTGKHGVCEDSADDNLGSHERHIQLHICDQCGKTYSSSDALARHSKVAHQGKGKPQPVKYKIRTGRKETHFECATCKKTFPSKSDAESHSCRDHTNKPHCCEFCQKLFKSSVSLGVHRRKFHSSVKTCVNSQSDASHSVKKEPGDEEKERENEQRFTCCDCGQSFETSRCLSGHRKQAHSPSSPREGKGLIKCEVCPKTFRLKRSLTLHMKSHSSQRLGQTQKDTLRNKSHHDRPPPDSELLSQPSQNVDSCSDNDSLQEQTLTNISEPPFSCSLCERTFKSKRGLQGHQQREHSQQWPRANKCDKCDAVFRFKTQLTKHRRSHRDERPFSCGQCGARFKSSASLGLHSSWHEDMRSSVCHLCGKSCLGLKSLTRHIKMHHGSEHTVEKPYKCSDCTASFTSLSKLTAHMGVHNQQNFVCGQCGQAFRSEHILSIHVRRHTGETPFQCSECPQSFMDKSRLKRHQLQHRPLSQELCHVCGAGFPSKAHLAFHLQRHTTERPFRCGQCGKAYKTTGDLKSHTMSHSDDRPFQCDHCPYAARTKAMLNKHVRKHTGERPYRCEQCSAAFTYFSCLSAHRKLHSNTKPFVCEVCSASFFTAYNLRLHSRKHSGERPYKCSLCAESFSWHSGLKCHMKKHSGGAGGGAVVETSSA